MIKKKKEQEEERQERERESFEEAKRECNSCVWLCYIDSGLSYD